MGVGEVIHGVELQFLFKFNFRGRKKLANQQVKRVKCDQVGNLGRRKGRNTATSWAGKCD